MIISKEQFRIAYRAYDQSMNIDTMILICKNKQQMNGLDFSAYRKLWDAFVFCENVKADILYDNVSVECLGIDK